MSKILSVICFSFLFVLVFVFFGSCDSLQDKEIDLISEVDVPLIPENQNQLVDNQIIIKVSKNQNINVIDLMVPGKRSASSFSIGNYDYFIYNLDNPDDSDKVLKGLNSGGLMVSAEQNSLYSHCDMPNDAFYNGYQYAPQITNCEDAWDIQQGAADIIVAVLDTGINGEHEDLQGRVLEGYNILLDEVIPANTNSDDNRHGTHVAGIIAAKGNNET
ncbi:MAG: S8 family serine peptidase [Spirochaetales bacterium]|nr:S8 family serine peptidase [Spirochaetales bacterium]